MVTADPAANIDAAIHVAHAFTVHGEEPEYDFFTVVDDLHEEGSGQGAADHLNESELVCGLFDGYVVVDRNTLLGNLVDKDAVLDALRSVGDREHAPIWRIREGRTSLALLGTPAERPRPPAWSRRTPRRRAMPPACRRRGPAPAKRRPAGMAPETAGRHGRLESGGACPPRTDRPRTGSGPARSDRHNEARRGPQRRVPARTTRARATRAHANEGPDTRARGAEQTTPHPCRGPNREEGPVTADMPRRTRTPVARAHTCRPNRETTPGGMPGRADLAGLPDQNTGRSGLKGRRRPGLAWS